MQNKAMETRLNAEIQAFIDSRRSLQLATLGEDSLPYASYAPFAYDEDSLYVILSDMALHGLNLIAEPRASVLIIEDEDSAAELFARRRVGYQIVAQELPWGAPEWHSGIECLEERHGERARLLSQLAGFRLFRLRPTSGRYGRGFGKAYQLSGGKLAQTAIDHLRDGRRPRQEQAA